MKKLVYLLCMFTTYLCFAQVGIGTTTPDQSAILDVSGTDGGILVPRVSLVNVSNTTTPILSPADGLLIWNTNVSVVGGTGVGFYFFNNGNWISITQGNTLDQAYDEGGTGAGRSIIADAGAVKVEGEDGLVITGTFGSGATVEEAGAGTRMFFNPRKAAFRAGFVNGTQWDNTNIGDYSFAVNRNTTASGENSFAANQDNVASGTNSTSFGNGSTASGTSSFTIGTSNIASGLNAFASGNNTIASGDNSFSGGQQSQAISINEVVLGNFPSTYTMSANGATVFDSLDRAFAIGIGSGPTTPKSGFEVYKDGRVIINEAYTLPVTDGTLDQIIKTDGAGNLSWEDPTTNNIVSQAIYTNDVAFTSLDTNAGDDPTNVDLTGFDTVVIPTLYNALGDVEIKLIVRCTVFTPGVEFRVRAHDGTTGTNVTNYGTAQTYTATQNGGVIETDWVNWSAGLTAQEIRVQARTENGETITVTSAYILIKSQ